MARTVTGREQEAIDEMTRTAVSPGTAWAMSLVFVALLAIPAIAHLCVASGPLTRRAIDIPTALTDGLANGELFAASHATLAAIDDFEAELRNGSPLAATLRPATQTLLFTVFGQGNSQVRPGKDDARSDRDGRVLYFKPSLDHLLGPPFLSRAWHQRRERSSKAWKAAPSPDPRPAIRHFAEDLLRQGVELVVVPIPVKPSVDHRALGLDESLVNPSWHLFQANLQRQGIGGVDALSTLRALEAPRFLETDSHWRPEAMDAVAADIARELGQRGVQRQPPLPRSAPSVVEGVGDLGDLLGVWEATVAPDRVEVARLTARPSQTGATVLLLGDSFAGIYDDPTLGFGDGAGLADTLAHHLGQPVDAIIVNDGGAWQTRQVLADDPTRLKDIDVVVWVFTARQLQEGDWRIIPLTGGQVAVDTRWMRLPEGAQGAPLRGTVTHLSAVGDPRTAPYPDQIRAMRVEVEGKAGGEGGVAWVFAWAMKDRQLSPSASLSPGDRISAQVGHFSDAPEAATTASRTELAERPTAAPLLWVQSWEEAP